MPVPTLSEPLTGRPPKIGFVSNSIFDALTDDRDEKDYSAGGKVLLHDAQEEQEAKDVRGRAHEQEQERGDQRRDHRGHRHDTRHSSSLRSFGFLKWFFEYSSNSAISDRDVELLRRAIRPSATLASEEEGEPNAVINARTINEASAR